VILLLVLPFVMMYYVFSVNWRASLKRLYLAGFVGGLVCGGLASAYGPEKLAESIGVKLDDKQGANQTGAPSGEAPADDTSSGP
jgi:hypothetical protein